MNNTNVFSWRMFLTNGQSLTMKNSNKLCEWFWILIFTEVEV